MPGTLTLVHTRPEPLTKKRLAFATAYVSGETAGNAKRSAMAAGYPERSASVTASRLLKDPRVLSFVANLRARLVSTPVVPPKVEQRAETKAVNEAKPWLELVPLAQRALLEGATGVIVTLEDGTQEFRDGASPVRILAADKILDRALGKPVPGRAPESAQDIDAALAALE